MAQIEFIMNVVKLTGRLETLDTKMQCFDLKQIKNRRFLYSSKHHALILGDAQKGILIEGTHSQDFHEATPIGTFDDYIRGWIGRNSSDYKYGIIHFAPQLYVENLDEGIALLRVLSNMKGFGSKTKVRGFKNIPETSLIELLPSLFKHNPLPL